MIPRFIVGLALAAGLPWTALAQNAVAVAKNEPATETRAAEQLLARPVTIDIERVTVRRAIDIIAANVNVSIDYALTAVDAYTDPVSVHAKGVPLGAVLKQVLAGTRLYVAALPEGRLVIAYGKQGRAQDGIINGRVIDAKSQQPLAGVSVTLDGAARGVVTDEKGRFRLTSIVAGSHQVTLRRLGYTRRVMTVTVADDRPATLELTLDPAGAVRLTEVVTTGAGEQRRVEVGNDVATINADSIMRTAPVRNVTDMLAAARVPGVEVIRSSGLPGAPSRIRIRGVGSLSRSNDPAVIVNGVWVNSSISATEVQNNLYATSPLDDIDPASIESIEILRGPSAAALYGTDAANGVIVIKTKRGTAGKTRWNWSYDHDWNTVPGQKQPAYEGYGHAPAFPEEILAGCILQDVMNLFCVQDSVSAANPANSALLSNEAAGRNSRYTMSVSGGASTIQYALTGTYQDQLGPSKLPLVDAIRLRRFAESTPGWLTRPDAMRQSSISTQLTLQPMPVLDVALNFAATQVDLRGASADFTRTDGGVLPAEDTLLAGALYRGNKTTRRETSGLLSLNANWRPWAWLTPRGSIGLERRNIASADLSDSHLCVGSCGLPTADRGFARQEQTTYTVNLGTAIPISLGRWERFLSLKPSVGANLRRETSNWVNLRGDSLALGSDDIGTAARRTLKDGEGGSAVAGWYLDVQVGVWQRLYTSFGFRKDIGNALSERIRAPTYPKLQTSWLISDESFFPKTNILKSLRLRIAYGQSGVQPDATATYGSFNGDQANVNGVLVPAVFLYRGVVRNGNYLLKPERGVEVEYGFDTQLFGDRTQIGMTIATKHNRNELLVRRLAPSAGGGAFTENVARVTNQTFELTTDHRVIDRGGMLWTAHVAMSTLVNRVDRLGNVLPFGTDAARIVEGYPINGIWQKPVMGYNDVNRDGLLQPGEIIVSDSLAYVGWNHPKLSMTYGTSLSFGNGRLTLDANLAYDGGLTQIQQQYDLRGLVDPQSSIAEQAFARVACGAGNSCRTVGNQQTINVLRFNTASATVMLPAAWSRSMRASQATVSLQGRNLGLWTQYRGRDPGVNSTPFGTGTGANEFMNDNGTTIPQPRVYAVSVRVTY